MSGSSWVLYVEKEMSDIRTDPEVVRVYWDMKGEKPEVVERTIVEAVKSARNI